MAEKKIIAEVHQESKTKWVLDKVSENLDYVFWTGDPTQVKERDKAKEAAAAVAKQEKPAEVKKEKPVEVKKEKSAVPAHDEIAELAVMKKKAAEGTKTLGKTLGGVAEYFKERHERLASHKKDEFSSDQDEGLEEEKAEKKRVVESKTSLTPSEPFPDTISGKMTSFNLVNITTGPLLYCSPVIYLHLTLWTGFLLTFAVGLSVWASLCFTVTAGRLEGATSLAAAALSIHGAKGYYVVSMLLILYSTNTIITYNVLLCDNISRILTLWQEKWQPPANYRRHVLIIMNATVLLILCSIKRISIIAKFSFFICVFNVVIFLLLAIVAVNIIYEMTIDIEATSKITNNIGLSIPVIYNQLCLVPDVLLLNKALQLNSTRRWNQSSIAAMVIAVVINILLGSMGFMLFTINLQANIMNNLCIESQYGFTASKAARLFASIIILICFPYHVHCIRELFKKTVILDKYTTMVFYLTTFLILTVGVVFAYLIDCVLYIIEFNGIFTTIPLVCIIPPYFYVRAQKSRTLTFSNAGAASLLILGISIFLYSVPNFISHPRTETCAFTHEPIRCQRLNQTEQLMIKNEDEEMMSDDFIF